MIPKVSICLPSLNTRPFLKERIRSILEQTYKNWELIILDSFSDDGSWEYFQKIAKKDDRIFIKQIPREGIYAGWNRCVGLARGEYVYIATSDDTMEPECLDKMISKLDKHPDCGICHCELKIIDENGNQHIDENWSTWKYFAPDWTGKTVKRLAPFDGLLHFGLRTLYTSINQLLIRRSVFDRVGLFDTNWGTVGDFEWEMRAALVTNVIYIPEYLTSWRRHSNQATRSTENSANRRMMLQMARSAFNRSYQISPNLLTDIKLNRWLDIYKQQILEFQLKENQSKMKQILLLCSFLLRGFRPAWRCMVRKIFGIEPYFIQDISNIKKLLDEAGVPGPVLL